jgi:hypothetical protein
MSTYITELDAADTPLDGTEPLIVSQLSATIKITATTLSAAASDNSFNDSGSGFVTAGFAEGDRIGVSGFTGNTANNIYVGTIETLTAGKMIIASPEGDVLVDDAAGESVTIAKWESRRVEAQEIAGATDQVITLLVTDPNGAVIATGDGAAYYRIPSILNGRNLVGVAAALTAASSSGAVNVQIRNATQAADMLSTALTIDASETDSSSAATPAVIDGVNDDVATGDMIRVDIDGAGTNAKGLIVELRFGV